MDNKDIKNVYQKVIDRYYACALLFDRMAINAYTLGFIGFKWLLLKESKCYWKYYKKLKHTSIILHSNPIYPNLKYAESLLNKVDEINVSPLSIDEKTYTDRLKKMIVQIRDYTNETQQMLSNEISTIQHSYPADYNKINCMVVGYASIIKCLAKTEALYDRYSWDSAFVANHQKKMHDSLHKKNKY